tara:strand:+ start:695 stop:1132 length:438 start_codon:yes stop_codon:yes gene_type:complete
MLARKIAQCEQDYHISRARALEDYSIQIKRSVGDYLEHINQNYPFNSDCFPELYAVVMEQLQQVISANDFRHIAFDQIRNGKINWLAEPFFKGEKLMLSLLIDEYDKYKHDQNCIPSSSCRKLFYVWHDSANHKRKRDKEESEWD